MAPVLAMKRIRGVTLIELLVVAAIVAILAAIAYPSYLEQVVKTRRAEGKATLNEVSQRLERCFTRFGSYLNANCTAAASAASENGWYAVSTSSVSATGYTLQAVPNTVQAAADIKCGTLTINHVGVRSQSGTPPSGYECW